MLITDDLEEKVAIVTGATKGIGKYIAINLAKVGMDIIVTSRHLGEAEKVAYEITELGRQSLALQVDVSDVASIMHMVKAAHKTFGRIDVLINNAGTAVTKKALYATEEEWDKVIDTNLKGAFFCSQSVARVMKDQGGGSIINIASAGGAVGVPGAAPYCISKAGIIHMTKLLALEWVRYNISVNAIGPGYIKTELNAKNLSDEKFHQWVIGKTPMRRLGELEELMGSVYYFASNAASYTTGQTLFVDGGWVL